MPTDGMRDRGFGKIVRPDDPRRWQLWPPEDIIQALKDYEQLFGNSTAACFSISTAKWRDRPELRERYIAGNPLRGTPWPSLNTIKSRFNGSFDEARRAAGLKPNKSGPASGRRPAGEHAPSREVRDRVLVLPPERSVVATKRAERAEEKVRRLERKVERLQAERDAALERVAELEGAAVSMVKELTT